MSSDVIDIQNLPFYKYCSLPGPRFIRLLHVGDEVLQFQDGSLRKACTLEVRDIDDKLEYVALSYT